MSALVHTRRVRILAAGYAVVGVFALVAVVARWGFGVPDSRALAAGGIAAVPIVVALMGDRITGIKAFSVEVSLAQITVPIQVDLTRAVMAIAEMGPSGSPELMATFWDAIRSQARLLRLNLRENDTEITTILMDWPGKFGWNEDQAKQIVTSDLLRRWLGADLDTEALPHGPLTPLLRYQVNMRSHRYTALTTDGRLIAVVDKSELAARTTEAILDRQLA